MSDRAAVRPGDAVVDLAEEAIFDRAEAVALPEVSAGKVGGQEVQGTVLISRLTRPCHRVREQGRADTATPLGRLSEARHQVNRVLGCDLGIEAHAAEESLDCDG